MIVEENTATGGQLYYRLITLCVIRERVAGGINHELNLPFSGMFLSGFAVSDKLFSPFNLIFFFQTIVAA